jgi:hypothetical protein
MTAISFIPSSDNDKGVWLNNFSLKLGIYAPGLGITPTEVQSVNDDSVMFQYMLNLQEVYRQTLQNIVGYKNLLKHAVGQPHLGGAIPTLPALATPPAAVPEGIFDRVRKLVARIKVHPDYTTNLGSDLGIIASVPVFDPATVKPDISIRLEAGRPYLKWVKGQADAMDLYVDRNDGAGFVILGRLMRNEYLDVASLSANKVIDEWSYKGVFVIADQPVGQYSAISSISVKKQ